MAKKNRTEFFDESAPLNSRGKRINLKTDGQPDEALFQDLVDSTVFFNEDIASDAEAKANSGGVETKVPKVEQLPTVATDDADIEIAVDGATSTRNNFFVRLSATFKSAFSSVQTSVTNLYTSVYGSGGTPATPTAPSLLTTVYGPSGDPNAPDGGLVVDGSPSSWQTVMETGATFDQVDDTNGPFTFRAKESALSSITNIMQSTFEEWNQKLGNNLSNDYADFFLGGSIGNPNQAEAYMRVLRGLGQEQSIKFNALAQMLVTDIVNSKGLEYSADYSSNFTAHSLVTKQYVDLASGGVAWKSVNIGDWNMDTNESISVPHGLSATEWKTIRSVDAIVRSDDDTVYHPIDAASVSPLDSAPQGGVRQINDTNIVLARALNGLFDGPTFDSIAYNRGFVRLQYTPD
jgi:hypothetical protein